MTTKPQSAFRGKRVYVQRTLPHVHVDSRGNVVGPLLGGNAALQLSCGHRIRSASFVWSSGDPVWCEECAGAACRACGVPATVCREPSLEWGEACATCAALSEDAWVDHVEMHRLDTMSAEQHVESAQHFWRGAQKTERNAADPKYKYFDHHPITRRSDGLFAKELFVKSLVHVLYLFVLERRT